MQRLITTLIVFVFLGSQAGAQGKVKLFVYAQSVSPGVRQITVDMGDPELKDKTPPAKTNYFVYLWQKKARDLEPQELWIGNRPYTLSVTDLGSEPVQQKDQQGVSRELVPGGARLLRLTPTGTGDEKQDKTRKLERCLKKAEAVLVFRYRGKTRYTAAKKILQLESVPMQ